MYFKKSKLDEIYNSKSLFFASLLFGLLHIINAASWIKPLGSPEQIQLCWESIPHCSQYMGQSFSSILNKIYLGLSLLLFVGLFLKAHSKVFFSFILVNIAIKAILYFTHFNLNHNIHSFLFFAEIVFFLLPQKTNSLRYLTAAYLVAIGLLKLNPVWLSGFWLEQYFMQIPSKGVEWMATFSMFIELFTALALLHRNAKVFFTSVLVLSAYVIAQAIFFPVFQPLTLFGLVIFFIIDHYENQRIQRESVYRSFSQPEASLAWSFLAPVIYFIYQTFIIWGSQDSSLRNFPLSLRHFPTPVQCQQYSFIESSKGWHEVPHKMKRATSNDFDCYPNLALKAAKKLCERPDSKDALSVFIVKKGQEKEFSTAFHKENLCKPGAQL